MQCSCFRPATSYDEVGAEAAARGLLLCQSMAPLPLLLLCLLFTRCTLTPASQAQPKAEVSEKSAFAFDASYRNLKAVQLAFSLYAIIHPIGQALHFLHEAYVEAKSTIDDEARELGEEPTSQAVVLALSERKKLQRFEEHSADVVDCAPLMKPQFAGKVASLLKDLHALAKASIKDKSAAATQTALEAFAERLQQACVPPACDPG